MRGRPRRVAAAPGRRRRRRPAAPGSGHARVGHGRGGGEHGSRLGGQPGGQQRVRQDDQRARPVRGGRVLDRCRRGRLAGKPHGVVGIARTVLQQPHVRKRPGGGPRCSGAPASAARRSRGSQVHFGLSPPPLADLDVGHTTRWVAPPSRSPSWSTMATASRAHRSPGGEVALGLGERTQVAEHDRLSVHVAGRRGRRGSVRSKAWRDSAIRPTREKGDGVLRERTWP